MIMSLEDIDYTHESKMSRTNFQPQRLTARLIDLTQRVNVQLERYKPINVEKVDCKDGMVFIKKSVGEERYPIFDTDNYNHLPEWFRKSNSYMGMYRFYRDYGKTCDRCGNRLSSVERQNHETLCYKCERMVGKLIRSRGDRPWEMK